MVASSNHPELGLAMAKLVSDPIVRASTRLTCFVFGSSAAVHGQGVGAPAGPVDEATAP